MLNRKILDNPSKEQKELYVIHLECKANYRWLERDARNGLERQPDDSKVKDFDLPYLKILVEFHAVSVQMWESIFWAVKEECKEMVIELIETERRFVEKFQIILDQRSPTGYAAPAKAQGSQRPKSLVKIYWYPKCNPLRVKSDSEYMTEDEAQLIVDIKNDNWPLLNHFFA